jgi:hypothetical protein
MDSRKRNHYVTGLQFLAAQIHLLRVTLLFHRFRVGNGVAQQQLSRE